jgi:hypothetical protein
MTRSDAKLRSDGIAFQAIGSEPSNLKHLSQRQLGCLHGRSLRARLWRCSRSVSVSGGRSDWASQFSPALADHVRGVVTATPKEQMRRVHARRVVALVQYASLGREMAVGQHPRDAMRLGRPVTVPACTVAKIELPAGPHPALIWPGHLDLGPEPLRYRDSITTFRHTYNLGKRSKSASAAKLAHLQTHATLKA